MAERFSDASVHLDVTAGEQRVHSVPDPETPFRILVVGDFSGRANREASSPLAGRRPRQVDCDDLDEAVAEMQVALALPHATLRFREIEDFHPDRIYRSAEIFRKLADTRTRPPQAPAQSPPPAALKPGQSLLDSMMEETDEASAEAVVEGRDSLADFLKKAVAPHLVAGPDPGKVEWAAKVDAAAGEQMRAVLHNPQFQAVEAAWRAVDMLVQRLGPDSELKIYLLDATLDEVTSDLEGFSRCLGQSDDGWALIVGNFVFGQSPEDAARLQKLGRIAAVIGAPFLAEGQPPAGNDPGAHWAALRRSPEARWIGLALPRFLLRAPYGKGSSEVESFAFEEMPRSVHGDYLWGNPAFACACLIGEAFRAEGWNLRTGYRRQIAGLPLHVYRSDGEAVAKPCAEVLLTEKEAGFLLDAGLIPVASMKDQDAVLVPRIQSIAEPPAALSGRWAR